MTNFDCIAETIKSFCGQANTISIPKKFIEFTGSFDRAAVLSQLVFWSDKGTDKEWFYKSYKDWEKELMLSEYQVRTICNGFIEKGFLKTKLRKVGGFPTVHYSFRFNVFAESFLEFLRKGNSLSEKIKDSDSLKIKDSLKTELTTDQEHHKNDGAASPENSSDSKPLDLKPVPPNPPVTGNMDSQNENTSLDASVSQDFEGGGSRDASEGDRGGTGQPRFNPGPFFVAWKEKSGVRDANGILRGGDMPRSWLKTLKGVVTEFGQECALDAWKNYLNLNQLQFNPTAFKFARTIVEWMVAEKPKDSGLTPDGYEWRK
jgi:hypothetical protein